MRKLWMRCCACGNEASFTAVFWLISHMTPIRWGSLATGNVDDNMAQALGPTARSFRVTLTR